MSDAVKIVECPRDAWQGLHGQIAAEIKATYLRSLIDAGFTHIDAVSFVSPAAVPQMADSERVLELLGPQNAVDIIGIVVNEKARIGPFAPARCTRSAIRTRSLPDFFSAISIRRSKNRLLRCEQLSRGLAQQIWMLWPISRWLSEIPMESPGVSAQF